MYKLDAQNYAADFFKEQSDLSSAKVQRDAMQAQSMRSQAEFTRNQGIQQITDQTLKNLSDIGAGRSSSTQRAVEELANDAFNNNPVKKSTLDQSAGVMPQIGSKPVQFSGDKSGGSKDTTVTGLSGSTRTETPVIRTEPVDYSLGQMATTVGDALMKAGYGAEGMSYVKEGIDYYGKLADAETKRSEQVMKTAEGYMKIADYMYEGLADVKTQDEQDRFFKNMPPEMVEVLGKDNVLQMAQQPFDEDVISHYRDRALSTKDTYSLSLQAEGKQLQADRDAASALDRQARTRIAEQRRIDQKFIAENKEKAGGKNSVIVVQPNEIAQSRTKIVADVFKGVRPKAGTPDGVLLDDAAGSIASEAKQMATSNPGLTYDQALSRVVTQRRGDFIQPRVKQTKTFLGVEVPGTSKIVEKGSPQYKPRGATQERPIVLKSRADAGKMVAGHWYTYNGRTLQYNPN